MIKAANGKAEGGKEVENDLTRSSLWSVLIFRALPLKRSTLYNAAPLLPAHFLAPLPHIPFPYFHDDQRAVLVYPRRDRARIDAFDNRDDNVAREL